MPNVTVPTNNITYASGTGLNLAGVAGVSVTSSDTGLIPPGRNVFIRVKNSNASAVTVTVAAPGTTSWNAAIPDLTVTVGANTGDVLIGPLDANFADPADGLAKFTVSDTVNASGFKVV